MNSEAVFAALSREKECYFIHRIDRNTKGLLVFARTEKAEKALLCAFKEKAVEKRYHALCFGAFPKSGDVLTAYLKKNEKASLVHIYDAPVVGAEKIITEYKVLEIRGEISKAEITLHTGKTHQIRAHMAHIGHPLLGDGKYGVNRAERGKGYKHQALYAVRLRFDFDNAGILGYLSGKEFSIDENEVWFLRDFV